MSEDADGAAASPAGRAARATGPAAGDTAAGAAGAGAPDREALDAPAPYPVEWEADVILRDGGVAHVRPIRPEDADALERFHEGQSAESIYFRFFAPMPRLSPADLYRFTHVDHLHRVAFVVTIRDDIIGVARYDHDPDEDLATLAAEGPSPAAGPAPDDEELPGSAEVAFNISDAHQGRGIGSVLLEHLAAAARENGILRFTADVLPTNRKMLAVFREAGYEVSHRYDDGVIRVTFDIDPTERAREVMAAREHRAESLSMRALLNARSVVVVGASRDGRSIGSRFLAAVRDAGFAGPLHVVNREAFEVGGLRAWQAASEVPGPVDLAVLAVPAPEVAEVLSQCVALGVRGAVVVSSGFAEAGEEGLARQVELVRLARSSGIRVVGPNSFGIINTDPAVRLNASVAPQLPDEGRLALFSQSGALGIAVLSSAERRGLGLSSFVSAGNRADVSGNDCMQYWVDDPRTAVVGLYLESVGNPRKFSRVARLLARAKPTIVVKSGTSEYGVPPGHTVRRSRAPRAAFDAMLRQAGVIRTENLHQLFDVAQVVLTQPLPAGDRVAVVGNSPALGALAADACASWGLRVAGPPTSIRGDAPAEEVEAALAEVYARGDVDAVVASFVPPLQTETDEIAAALVRAAQPSGRTTVACWVGSRLVRGPGGAGGAAGGPGGAADGAAGGQGEAVVPAYPLPEDAVRALAATVRYAQWRRRETGPPVAPEGIDARGARRYVAGLLGDRPRRSLSRAQTVRLLGYYGVDVWPSRPARTPEEAVAAAEALGWPVVLKADGLRHRADAGGIRTAIADADELRADVAEMQALLGQQWAGTVLVQRMAPVGVSCVVTTSEDPLFGPVVSFRFAGDAHDLLGDVTHRIPPLTTTDVADLVRGSSASPLLFGHGGRTPVDVASLEDVVGRLSRLAEDLPQVAELAVQPVHAHAAGVAVLDATCELAHPPGRSDSGRRAMTAPAAP